MPTARQTSSCVSRWVLRGRGLARGAAVGMALLAVMAAGVAAGARPARGQVTDAEVRQCIERAVKRLKQSQKTDGQWETVSGRHGGMTALAVLALVQAGTPVADPAVAKGLAALEQVPDTETYVVSLRMMAFLKADQASERPRYRQQIAGAVDWLTRAQSTLGTWGYDMRFAKDDPLHTTDNSNTQMALLALYEAARAGYKVYDGVWKRAEDYFVKTQMNDGGWVYRFEGPTPQQSGPSYGSMTAAGLATLYITGSRLQMGAEDGWDDKGVAKDCGKYRQSEPIAQALRWLDKRFTVETNPGLAGYSWHYYYLYALERVGIVSGQRFIGSHDWFREGADYLVRHQREDGGFERGDERGGPVADYDIAFAIMFLAKGHVPCLVNKLRWGAKDSDWNNDRYDMENLTRWIGDRLNGKPVGWQTVGMGDEVETWLEAPILYLTGHTAPVFTEAEKKKLRRYTDLGGTILADACCNRKEFADGIRKLAEELYADAKLEALPKDHPVYRAWESVPADWPIEAVTYGCRAVLLLSPRDLSCYWEQSDKPQSEAAMKMGLNVAAYVTARQALPDRLASVELIDELPEVKMEPGALYVAKAMHRGDWNSRPQAMDILLDDLRLDASVKTANRVVPMSLGEAKLLRYPVLYFVGHYDPKLTPEEEAGLRNYIERGGFVFVEACCGMPQFDKAFRELMAKLFPENPLQPIAADSPLVSGQVGSKIEKVKFTPRVLEEHPGLDRPVLEGLKMGDRYAVIYSPYAIGPGLDGIATYQSRGYVAEDARRLAVNIMLYALKY